MNKYLKLLLITSLGAVAGYAYYFFIGCESGCEIQSSWVNSTLYGAVIGFIVGIPVKKKN